METVANVEHKTAGDVAGEKKQSNGDVGLKAVAFLRTAADCLEKSMKATAASNEGPINLARAHKFAFVGRAYVDELVRSFARSLSSEELLKLEALGAVVEAEGEVVP